MMSSIKDHIFNFADDYAYSATRDTVNMYPRLQLTNQLVYATAAYISAKDDVIRLVLRESIKND